MHKGQLTILQILGSWMTTYLGKSCSFGLLRVPFVNCRQFMYLVISLLVLRAGCGIWLYQFLIIAYHFTLHYRIILFPITKMVELLHLSHDHVYNIMCIKPIGMARNRIASLCVSCGYTRKSGCKTIHRRRSLEHSTSRIIFMTSRVNSYRWRNDFGKLNMYSKIIALGDFTTICFSCTYVLCCVCSWVTSIPFWWRYIHSFIATAAGQFRPFPVHLRAGSFVHFTVPVVFRPRCV